MYLSEATWPFELTPFPSDRPIEQGATFLQAVSWYADGRLNDAPSCVCPVLAEFTRTAGQVLCDVRRQLLKGYVHRMIDTVDPESERDRAEFLAKFALSKTLPDLLRRIRMDQPAERLEQLMREGRLYEAGKYALEIRLEIIERGPRRLLTLPFWSRPFSKIGWHSGKEKFESIKNACFRAADAIYQAYVRHDYVEAARQAAMTGADFLPLDMYLGAIKGVLLIGRRAPVMPSQDSGGAEEKVPIDLAA